MRVGLLGALLASLLCCGSAFAAFGPRPTVAEAHEVLASTFARYRIGYVVWYGPGLSDNFNVVEDSGSNILDVLPNDTDADGGPKFVAQVTQPTGGSVVVGPAGADVRFTPNNNFCAATSFTYPLNGGSTTTVSISMTCSNDAPEITAASGQTSPENSATSTVAGSVTASDPDPTAVAPAARAQSPEVRSFVEFLAANIVPALAGAPEAPEGKGARTAGAA